jgi:hypothetical protein
MEAEYDALSTSCCDLFPLIDVAKEISSVFLLNLPHKTNIHITIHEDNVGTLMLGQFEP